MMKTEKVLSIIALTGILMRFLDIAGGGVFLTLALFTLAIVYFPLAFYFLNIKNKTGNTTAASVIAGLFLSIPAIGITFKLQMWRGPIQVYLGVGFVAALVLLLVSIYLLNKADENEIVFFKKMRSRAIIWFVASLFFYSVSTPTLLSMQFKDDPERLRLEMKVYENPGNKEYGDELYRYIVTQDSIEHYQKKSK